MDYAASIWHKIQDRGQFAEKMLEGVQRLSARMVTGAFKTAGVILEAEAGLFPITIRLQLKIMRYTIGLHTLPDSHPWWQLRRNIQPTTTKMMSPLRRMLKEFERDARGPKKTTLEVIQPFSRPPPAGNAFEAIIITADRDLAAAKVLDSLTVPAIYTDGSAMNGLTRHAVVWHRAHLPT
jgi:hypothetical protein